MSYTEVVHSFVTRMKESPQRVADLWNALTPLVDNLATPLAVDDTKDIIAEGIEIHTRSQMRAKLVDMGWDSADMAEVLKGVAIDDSYRVSAFLDVTDPDAPRVVMPCDVPVFADRCGDDEYIWDGVLTWRAIQELGPVLAAANMIAITKDFEMLTFPVPEPAGGRKPSRAKKPNRKTRKAKARK